MINNGGGAEFHIVPSHNELKTIDLHIGAAHHQVAKGWVESLGFEYISDNAKTIVFEAFTDLETDGQTVLKTYRKLEKQLRNMRNMK